MSDILAIFGFGVLIFLAVRFPPAAVFVYALTCGVDDARGASSFLRMHDLGLFVQMARIPFLLSVFVSFFKIWRNRRKGLVRKRGWLLACALGFCCVWIVVGSILKEEPLVSIPSILISAGIPASIVAMAYYRNRAARVLFVVMLVLQLSLSVLILLFPNGPLSELSALKYPMTDTELLGREEHYEGGVASLGLGERAFAQHHNPQAYGLYALVGAVVGGYLLLTAGAITYRLVGLGLLGAGLFGWSVTIPRAATFGLLAGVLSVLSRSFSPSRAGVWASRGAIVVTFSITLGLLIAEIPWKEATSVFPSVDSDIASRVEAIKTAVTQVLGSPLFGVTTQEYGAHGIPAHQIMLSFATLFGVPVGLCCLWFLCCAAAPTFAASAVQVSNKSSPTSWSQRNSRGEWNLSQVLGWILIGLSLSVNAAAPILFWVTCAVAWMPWAFSEHA